MPLRATLGMFAVLVGISGANAACAQGVPKLELSRVVVVDGDREQLGVIMHARVNAAGSIFAVVGRGERQMLVFGPDGKKRAELGRHGEGPGDFRAMRWTGFVGDSVWAADPFLKRITLYGPDLQLVRTKSIPKLSLPRGQQPQLPKTNGVYPFALFSDGSMLMQAFSYSNYLNQPTEGPLGVPVYRVSDAGVVQRKVGWIPVTRDIAGSVNRPQNWIQAHFANIPQHAVSADGAFFVTIIADVSDSSSLKAQVTLVRASGDTAYSRSIPVDAPRIPDSVMVKARRQQATDSKERQAVFKKIKLPEFYAPLHKAAVSTTGQVVIAFTSEAEHNNLNVRFRGAALREYLLLNADGSPRGVFVLPHRTELLQLDSDALWVTEYDEDDVPSIVRYRWS